MVPVTMMILVIGFVFGAYHIGAKCLEEHTGQAHIEGRYHCCMIPFKTLLLFRNPPPP